MSLERDMNDTLKILFFDRCDGIIDCNSGWDESNCSPRLLIQPPVTSECEVVYGCFLNRSLLQYHNGVYLINQTLFESNSSDCILVGISLFVIPLIYNANTSYYELLYYLAPLFAKVSFYHDLEDQHAGFRLYYQGQTDIGTCNYNYSLLPISDHAIIPNSTNPAFSAPSNVIPIVIEVVLGAVFLLTLLSIFIILRQKKGRNKLADAAAIDMELISRVRWNSISVSLLVSTQPFNFP